MKAALYTDAAFSSTRASWRKPMDQLTIATATYHASATASEPKTPKSTTRPSPIPLRD